MMSAARVTSVTSLDAASRASDTSGSARLGLPIRITLFYVSKEFRLGNTEGFRSSGLSRTDWTGRGVDGITAQVSIPDYLPLYGSVALAGYPISATWGTSRWSPERSTLFPVVQNSQFSCATSMLQRLIASGSTFSRDSQRRIRQKTLRPDAACWITRNLLAQTQVCNPLSANRRSRSASPRQTCPASLDITRRRPPGLHQWR